MHDNHTNSMIYTNVAINNRRKERIMEDYLNTIGLDIGIGSCGSAVSDGQNILYMGTHVFETAKEASKSRKNRSQRRTLARKKWRKKQMLQAFVDFGLLTKDQIDQNGFLSFNTNSNGIVRPVDKTVYHLRQRALTEKVSERELLLCLYNMLHARGHFLMETIDFSKDSITFEDYKEHYYSLTEPYMVIPTESKSQFENDILRKMFEGSLKAKDIRTVCKNRKFTLNDDKDQDILLQILLLIAGYSSKPGVISPSLAVKGEKCDINKIRSSEEEMADFFYQCVELYDYSYIYRILADYRYLCDAAVAKADAFEEVIRKHGVNSDEYKTMAAEIKGKASSKAKHLRVIRNLENSFPNGLYVKEARAILLKQQEFNSKITDDFIEVCISIISARIPYFIGPLNEKAKNAWLTKTGNFKYSYAYSMKHGNPVNEHASIRAWKERMISRCSYLPDKYALPKGSFVAETFNIVNELNILKAIDENEDAYYLTREDKIKIFDNLFLKGGKVRCEEVPGLLGLKSFGTRKNTDQKRTLNNSYTLYPQIARLLPELKLNSITDLFLDPEKINRLEAIILSINLYDEEKTRRDYFIDEMNMEETTAAKLAKLKSASFYSFSKEFIMEQPMDPNGNSLMELLFEDNSSKFVNEQMTRITNAVDENGVYYDFSANKYEKKLRENGGKLDISLLMDEGKPVIPVSRPVIRSLNETMKVYTELVKVYGIPSRVVIETARDLKDHTVVKQQSASHFDNMKNLHGHLLKQLEEHKEYKAIGHVEDWEEIERYVQKNRSKIELYIRQNGIDLLTGEPILLNHLEEYEIDHILPRGFGDDSMDDKMLISKLANERKGDRLPLEFIASGEKIGNHFVTAGEYIRRVESLYDMKLISEPKRERLLLETSDDLNEFINQNLVDTRYIIREFTSILRAYNKVHGYTTHIVSLKAAYTGLYRRALGMDKVRNYGSQHHAHDAALLIVADKTLSHYYPHYDERKTVSKNDSMNTYHTFIQSMMSEDKKKQADLVTFIRKAFFYAYGKNYNSPGSIMEQIRKIVPFYSTKAEKNPTGQFFKATILKKKEFKDDAVLTIVGVNNDKHVFTDVECIAVDFYKVPAKKGNREHIAIHIPKVIVDRNGVINEQKYIALIQKHYKKDILIDENGHLRTEFFRFRAYKNDIIYNTEMNCPMTFNIGSIVNRSLEFKFINVFSYDDIYSNGKIISESLIKYFNLKTKANEDGVPFEDVGISAYVNYATINHFGIPLNDKRVATAIEKVKDDKNMYVLSNHLAYLSLIIDRPGTPPSIDGQCLLVANNNQIKQNKDAEYVKLKYNILGLRFISKPGCKLDIRSPKEICGAYTKIKREEFTWHITRDDVE